MPAFVHIALPIPTNRLFTYIITDADNARKVVGARALVPFGKRTLTGIIVEQGVGELLNAKYVHEILDEVPVFTENILSLTKWISDYYYCSWGEALSAALPQGMSPQSVISVKIVRNLEDEELEIMKRRAPKRAALLQLLMDHDGPLSVSFIQQKLESENISEQLEALDTSGYIEVLRNVSSDVQPKVQKALLIPSELFEDGELLQHVLDDLDATAPKQSALLGTVYLHQLTNQAPMRMSKAIKESGVSQSAVDSLVEKGFLKQLELEINRAAEQAEAVTLVQRDEAEVSLTDEQSHAVHRINEAISAGKAKTFLLHGVTGSGKTIVYIHSIQKVLNSDKTALILVPEISLTPQLIDRFRAVFGAKVAVLHSRMSVGERFDSWRAIRRGEIKIVLGARSALFAPLQNIGLIIVDEEHESSYKQESPSPRYNARDCSVIRGIIEQAVVVLGSATPSLESMYNAVNAKYHLLEIAERADGATLPTINVVDIKEQRKKKEMLGSFSKTLFDAIVERVQRKEGIILLQNRRGFSPRLECEDCGNIPMCHQCNVSLTYHKFRDNLRCHYCGYTVPASRACKECGNPEMKEVGAGTQRVEEELKALLREHNVEANMQRVDLDTTVAKGSFRKILNAFQNGETDILIGTQMVAKGLDISRVSLVGVVNADIQLFLPDFRASERTFQILTQVAGRAGRSKEFPGEVIIQTSQPQHQAIVSAKLGRFDIFFNDEMQTRKDANYPPFTRFVLIEMQGKTEDKVHEHATMFAKYLPRQHRSVMVLGPTKPTIDRLRSQYRRVIILKGSKIEDPSGNELRQVLHHAFSQYSQHHASSSIRITMDIDSFSSV